MNDKNNDGNDNKLSTDGCSALVLSIGGLDGIWTVLGIEHPELMVLFDDYFFLPRKKLLMMMAMMIMLCRWWSSTQGPPAS